MPVTTHRKRLDDKGNIVSNILMHDNGTYTDEKRFIEYDENGNVKSVKTVLESGTGKPEITQKETLTEYEYTFINDKYLVSKVTVDGRIQHETNYKSTYTAANGDTEYEAESTHYIYTDNTENPQLINTVSFKSTQLDPEGINVPGFDVMTITIENNKLNPVEDVKYTYGSTGICSYHKNTVWGTMSDGEIRGSVVEMYLEELEDSTDTHRHFGEYNSYYTIDKDGNVIDPDKSKMDDYTSDVHMELEGLEVKSIYRIVEAEFSDGESMKVELRTNYIPFNDTIIEESINTNLETGEVITKFRTLASTGEVIYKEYTENGTKHYMNISYVEDLDSLMVEEIVDEDTNLETGKKVIRNQSYMYNDNDEIAMITYKFGDSEDPMITHAIYEYDETGHRCKNIITEESITSKFYDNSSSDSKFYDSSKEVFTIMNSGYPMCKSVFEFCYNRLLASL